MARVDARTVVPYEVQVALVEAAGKVFWYWDDYRHFLRKCGVHATLVTKLTNAGLSKYAVMRELLVKLDAAGTPGRTVQLQLVRGLVALPLKDDSGAEARAAQADLRTISDEHGLLPETKAAREQAEENLAIRQRRARAEQTERTRREARETRQALFREYCKLVVDNSDTQGRGYRLEEMLCEVAALDGLSYTPPFRKGTVTQTDGMLTFEGFQYLIEARWRVKQPDVAQVAALEFKAERSLQSTRGLFIAVAGFRQEVVDELQAGPKNLLLMTGAELSVLFEGRLTLAQIMRLKVDEGAKKGHILFDISQTPSI